MTSGPVVEPLTPGRWPDVEALFGPNGACGGCWCAWWRVSSAEFERLAGDGARELLRGLVDTSPPGLLAYLGGEPVGWCAVAPRAEYPRIRRSRVMSPPDAEPADGGDDGRWAVPCFFVHRRHRSSGIATALLRSAVAFAARSGAAVVEGYPVVAAGDGRVANAGAFTGVPAMFAREGFEEVARHGARAIVRLRVAR